MAKCAVCRKEDAVYKVLGSVLGYRCAKRVSADLKLRFVLLPRERKRRAAIKKARREAGQGRKRT